jgi:DNA-binding NarL/FixJ family response regulator
LDVVEAHRKWGEVTAMVVANKIRIFIVDDHPLLREGIAAVIERQDDMVLVGEATNGQEAVEGFRTHRPDVTLMDLQMPEMGGIDAIVAIRREFSNARIVVLTTFQGDAQALRAFKAGACGYLLKNMLRKELVDTIRTVHAGRRRIPPEVAANLLSTVSKTRLRNEKSTFWQESRRGIPIKSLHRNCKSQRPPSNTI